VENTSAHNSAEPYEAPLLAAVVTVPGPIKAAEITDHKRILRILFLVDISGLMFNKYKESNGFTIHSTRWGGA